MPWGKLENTFRSHPKFRKLARRLDVREAEARGLLSGLWAWCLDFAPDGDLSSFDIEDIEIAAGWEGDSGKFTTACVDVRLIDVVNEHYHIHNWMDRAGSYKEAQKKAKKRKENEPQGPVLGQSGNVPDSPRTKSDSPGNSPREEKRGEERRREEKRGEEKNTMSTSRREADVLMIFDYYRSFHPRAFRKPNSKSKEWRAIKARLDEGYTVEEIKQAIDGCHNSPFHQGENDRGQKYDNLELIVRDGGKVKQFIEIIEAKARGDPTSTLNERTRRNLRAGQEWLGADNGEAT